jgi:SAM-dependent methyltransferase
MPETEAFWDFYWEVRLQELQNLGKKAAILAASRLIRKLAGQPDQPVRLLELGCGEGQIIGALVEGHAQVRSIDRSVGVDYIHSSIETCRRRYPGMRFIEGDFTDPVLLNGLGSFEIMLLVNALHEVFSAGYSPALGEVDVFPAKQKVEQTFASAVERLAPGGYLVLFDGLEMDGNPQEKLRIRFLSRQARDHFMRFAREYRPFRITYREVENQAGIELSQRDFTRYITKSIFLGKSLWQTERLESYQYFKESEFRAAVARQGLEIRELRTLTVDEEKWNDLVEIESPGASFPTEHILIIAQKAA